MSVEKLVNEGLEHHRAGRLDQAEEHYRRALEIREYPPALNLLGVVMAQTDRRSRGIEHMRRAVALSPSVRDFIMNLGAAQTEERCFADAIATLNRALSLAEDETVLLRLARACLGARRFTDAAGYSERALGVNNGSGDGWACLALAYIGLFQRDEARIAANRALTLKPGQAEARRALALAALYAGRFEEAEEECQRALESDPEYLDAQITLAQVYLGQDQALAAEDLLETILEKNIAFAEAYGVRMALRFKQGDYDAALSDANLAVGLRPDIVEMVFNRGRLLEAGGQLEPAIADYRQALALRPDFPPARQALDAALARLSPATQ